VPRFLLFLFILWAHSGGAALAGPATALPCGFVDAEEARVFRGASLSDLADPAQEGGSLREPARAALEYLKERGGELPTRFTRVHSVALHELTTRPFAALIDVFGRTRAFGGKPVAGIARVALDLGCALDGTVEVRGHALVLERPYRELATAVLGSIADRLLVLQDRVTGFRRSFPVELGAIDAVQRRGNVGSLTPVMPNSFVDRRYVLPKLHKPAYHRGMPYIPILHARGPLEAGPKVPPHFARGFAVHTWLEPGGFARGFLSHGCIRMRDADLHELLAHVEASPGPVPFGTQLEAIDGIAHPFPLLSAFHYAVFNAGTADAPRAVKERDEGGILQVRTVRVEGPAPELDARQARLIP
jgi:hypothetical protein